MIFDIIFKSILGVMLLINLFFIVRFYKKYYKVCYKKDNIIKRITNIVQYIFTKNKSIIKNIMDINENFDFNLYMFETLCMFLFILCCLVWGFGLITLYINI